MDLTITRVARESHYDGPEPGTTITLEAKLAEPAHLSYGAEPTAEVTRVETNVYSDEAHRFTGNELEGAYLSCEGYKLTAKGKRDKRSGFGLVHGGRLDPEVEEAIRTALAQDERCPEELRAS